MSNINNVRWYIRDVGILRKSVCAGILISIGAIVKLQCANAVVGAIMFSIGLFFILSMQMYLFTGKIGYITKDNWLIYPIIWFGNLVGCVISAILIRLANPSIQTMAREVMYQKFDMDFLSASILAFFCGIIMYLAVENYFSSKYDISRVFGVIIGVAVFILCGFEHSIADTAYLFFAIKGFDEAIKSMVFILNVTAFNAIGSIVIKGLLKKRIDNLP